MGRDVAIYLTGAMGLGIAAAMVPALRAVERCNVQTYGGPECLLHFLTGAAAAPFAGAVAVAVALGISGRSPWHAATWLALVLAAVWPFVCGLAAIVLSGVANAFDYDTTTPGIYLLATAAWGLLSVIVLASLPEPRTR